MCSGGLMQFEQGPEYGQEVTLNPALLVLLVKAQGVHFDGFWDSPSHGGSLHGQNYATAINVSGGWP